MEQHNEIQTWIAQIDSEGALGLPSELQANGWHTGRKIVIECDRVSLRILTLDQYQVEITAHTVPLSA